MKSWNGETNECVTDFRPWRNPWPLHGDEQSGRTGHHERTDPFLWVCRHCHHGKSRTLLINLTDVFPMLGKQLSRGEDRVFSASDLLVGWYLNRQFDIVIGSSSFVTQSLPGLQFYNIK